MQDQTYTNRFVDVQKKVKVFKDRLRQAGKSNAEPREDRLVQEAKELLDKELNSSRSYSARLAPAYSA